MTDLAFLAENHIAGSGVTVTEGVYRGVEYVTARRGETSWRGTRKEWLKACGKVEQGDLRT